MILPEVSHYEDGRSSLNLHTQRNILNVSGQCLDSQEFSTAPCLSHCNIWSMCVCHVLHWCQMIALRGRSIFRQNTRRVPDLCLSQQLTCPERWPIPNRPYLISLSIDWSSNPLCPAYTSWNQKTLANHLHGHKQQQHLSHLGGSVSQLDRSPQSTQRCLFSLVKCSKP